MAVFGVLTRRTVEPEEEKKRKKPEEVLLAVEILRVNKPLGLTTNNAAEYEGLNMGLEKAMEMGYTDVRACGDSKLVCEQLTGNWKVRSSNLYEPYRRAHDLISGLDKFEISHVPREYNTEADAEANKAAYRRGGKAFEEY